MIRHELGNTLQFFLRNGRNSFPNLRKKRRLGEKFSEIFVEKIGEAVGDDSSAMGEAMRKIAEDIFDEKIDGALENYDCSEAIQKALDDKDFESDMDDKIEKAFEEVDWAEELRNLRFRAV